MYIFKNDNLLVNNNLINIPSIPVLLKSHIIKNSLDLPEIWQEMPPWCEIDDEFNNFDNNYEWIDLREVWQRWGEKAFASASTAYQYMNWMRNSQFCSRCAAILSPRTEDKGLACPSCKKVIYAPLHPAIIVAIERDGKLLLARNTRVLGNRYSILAGFVEPGESLEQTVAREVMEEVGIKVQDIQYFGSQSWPFPCSLMLGFTARWESGELRPDGVELNDAGWFTPGEFPNIPAPISISRQLIDDFVKRHKIT